MAEHTTSFDDCVDDDHHHDDKKGKIMINTMEIFPSKKNYFFTVSHVICVTVFVCERARQRNRKNYMKLNVYIQASSSG